MALIVETGLGVADADSYNTLAQLEQIAADRGWIDWINELVAAKKEAAAREAALYLDTISRYKGRRLKANQGLEFPREGLVDWDGTPITGLPSRVRRAHALLARRALAAPLYSDLDRGGRIASESVAGAVSISYFQDAPSGLVFREAMQLLAPFVRDDRLLAVPGALAPIDPATETFRIGQFDGRDGE